MLDVATKVYPYEYITELTRLAKLDRNWLEWFEQGNLSYSCLPKYDTWLTRLNGVRAANYFGAYASSIWLVDGPKVFVPTLEQSQALAQIEVRLSLGEYAQPYPTIMIELPPGTADPYERVLCYHETHRGKPLAVFISYTKDHKDDIITTIAADGRPMEVSLVTYDNDAKAMAQSCGRGLRVAVNACLALANYGCQQEVLLKKKYAQDQALANEQSARGQLARRRLKEAIRVVTFSQEIKLHRTETRKRSEGKTGVEVQPHWRRGHWAMQPYGPENTLRKRILRPAVFVRFDLFAGDKSDTSTVYK